MKPTKETHGITKIQTSTKDKKQETITKSNVGLRPAHQPAILNENELTNLGVNTITSYLVSFSRHQL